MAFWFRLNFRETSVFVAESSPSLHILIFLFSSEQIPILDCLITFLHLLMTVIVIWQFFLLSSHVLNNFERCVYTNTNRPLEKKYRVIPFSCLGLGFRIFFKYSYFFPSPIAPCVLVPFTPCSEWIIMYILFIIRHYFFIFQMWYLVGTYVQIKVSAFLNNVTLRLPAYSFKILDKEIVPSGRIGTSVLIIKENFVRLSVL